MFRLPTRRSLLDRRRTIEIVKQKCNSCGHRKIVNKNLCKNVSGAYCTKCKRKQ